VPRVTIVDIARAAGVSKSTVSLVISGSALVKAETRQRVRAVVDELGYVYHRGAANLRLARSNIVGMVINDLSNPFFAELAVGIEAALQGSDYIPVIANTAESLTRQARVLRTMREHDAAGLILCPAGGTQAEALADFAAAGIPVVLAMRRVPGAMVSAVVPDNRAGAMAAVAHLARLGHRRLAFLGGLASMTAFAERSQGFRDGLAEAGLAADPSAIVPAMPTRAGGAAAMAAALALTPAPTAALCFNDIVAIGAVHALARHGLRAGADFAIVGFDDIAEAAHMSPPLTTVAVDASGLGAHAARMLLRRIESGAARAETHIGAARLVVRESCGAPGPEAESAAAALVASRTPRV
jgi:LacI family transcriptional regulator